MLYKSNIFSQASGSLDGTVFSHNSSGRYVRNRTIPVNPNTARQTVIRAIFGGLSSSWASTLTQAQRDSWEVYAQNVPSNNRVGDTIHLSGFLHYCRSNTPRVKAGIAAVAAGPTELTLPEKDTSLSVTAQASLQQLFIVFDNSLAWANQIGGALLISVGLPQPASRNFFDGHYRFAGSALGTAGPPPVSPSVINSPFVFAAGQKLWIRVRITRSDARLSTFFTATAIAQA